MVNWELERNRFWEIGKSVGLAYFLLWLAAQGYGIKVVTRIVWLMAKSRQFQHIRNQKTDLHEYLSSEICDF